MDYIGRFAPSPTGPLHFGSLVAALGSWLRARSAGGRWLVRIEDIDPPREVPGATRDILDTLAAFGLAADAPVVFQSTRDAAYELAFDALRAQGRVYPCWCSRQDLAASRGLHRGACRSMPDPTRAPAWRVRVDDSVVAFDDALQGPQSQRLADAVGDFVVRRVEGWFAYQLAVVVDDAQAGVTEVVRGSDLLDSTPRQIYLQRLLGLATPGYLHLPLVLDANGAKLSKRDAARPVERADPVPALRRALAFLGVGAAVGATPETLLRDATSRFDLARVPRGVPATGAAEASH